MGQRLGPDRSADLETAAVADVVVDRPRLTALSPLDEQAVIARVAAKRKPRIGRTSLRTYAVNADQAGVSIGAGPRPRELTADDVAEEFDTTDQVAEQAARQLLAGPL